MLDVVLGNDPNNCIVSPIHWQLTENPEEIKLVRKKGASLASMMQLGRIACGNNKCRLTHCWWAQGLVHVLTVVGFWCPCTEVWLKLSSFRSMTAGESQTGFVHSSCFTLFLSQCWIHDTLAYVGSFRAWYVFVFSCCEQEINNLLTHTHMPTLPTLSIHMITYVHNNNTMTWYDEHDINISQQSHPKKQVFLEATERSLTGVARDEANEAEAICRRGGRVPHMGTQKSGEGWWMIA